MTNITKTIKNKIADFLHDAASTVLHSYGRYLGSDLPEKVGDPSKKPEDFKKFHDAGKAAASHLESLLKLANATDDPEERKAKQDEEYHEHTQKLMEQADRED